VTAQKSSEMILQIAIFVVVLVFLYFEYEKRKIRHKLPPLAGAGLGSLGRVIALTWNLHRFNQFLEEQVKKLGLLFYVNLPIYGNIFMMVRPDDVKYILDGNFDNYVKGPFVHDALADLLGDGIFTVCQI
jgi:hypothetical protein